MSNYSFVKGVSQIRMRDIKEVRQKIMKALGIKHRASWIARLNGTIEPRVSEAKAIEEIFAEYGITDIWGGEE